MQHTHRMLLSTGCLVYKETVLLPPVICHHDRVSSGWHGNFTPLGDVPGDMFIVLTTGEEPLASWQRLRVLIDIL